MLDGEADRVSPEQVELAFSRGLDATEEIIQGIEDLQKSVGKTKRELEPIASPPQHIVDAIQRYISSFVFSFSIFCNLSLDT